MQLIFPHFKNGSQQGQAKFAEFLETKSDQLVPEERLEGFGYKQGLVAATDTIVTRQESSAGDKLFIGLEMIDQKDYCNEAFTIKDDPIIIIEFVNFIVITFMLQISLTLLTECNKSTQKFH